MEYRIINPATSREVIQQAADQLLHGKSEMSVDAVPAELDIPAVDKDRVATIAFHIGCLVAAKTDHPRTHVLGDIFNEAGDLQYTVDLALDPDPEQPAIINVD